VTYGELWAWANEGVRRLQSLGLGRSDRVAVVLPNGPEAAVAMIAVAIGAVCVPLNPGFTADEWRRYFDDLRVSALLTWPDMDSASRAVAHSLGIPVIDLWPRPSDGPGAFSIVGPATPRSVGFELAESADDAFILVTSGTTSRPKMVPLTHASSCLAAYNVGAALALKPRDRLLNVLPLFHGLGLITGVLAALAAGSSVVCTPGFDAAAFFGWLSEFRPTWYSAIPAIHRALLSAAISDKHRAQRCSLRLIRSASSPLPRDVLGGLEGLFGVPVIDTYGMTEATTQVTANPLARRKPGSVGQPAGPEVAIMDSEGRRLPAGERGEIVLRGPTITRGYYNDAVATESAFRHGWFRTGDLGYLDRDGYLFIVGRIKDVIKRGGHQVAPAEVEETLLSHPDVVEVAAFSIPHRRLGEDVAAAAVLRPDAKVSAQELRNFARERLAEFKVPGLIQIVPDIPKSAGGKIKRSGLAAALGITQRRARTGPGGKLVPPRSELERQLADFWTQLLEMDQIGIDEDVFALGADSITVMQVLSRLRAHFGVCFSLKDIFDAPTVATLAARLETSERGRAGASLSLDDAPTEIARVEQDGAQPVSIMQEYLLRIERKLPGLPQFNVPFAYRLRGPLNVPALERSLAEVVRRHDSLRTVFAWQDGLPFALVAPAGDANSSLVVAAPAASVPTGNGRSERLLLKKAELEVEQEALKPFDLNRAPLFRARLWRVGANNHVLLLILHDLIVDGWSMGVFMKEVSELYAAFAAGQRAQLPEPALQFSDFAHWQRQWSTSNAAARQLAYWKDRLREVPPVFPTNAEVKGALLAARVSQERIEISNDLVARLRALNHSRGATLFMTLLAGLKALLLARTGQDDICVATSMANRSQLQAERVIGPVANITIIRTRLDADLSFQEALSRVREAVLEAYARQELPFDMLAARLAKEDGLDPASLMQAFFVLRNAFRRPLKLPDVTVRPFANQDGQSVMPIDSTWISLALKETPSGIGGACHYKEDLFEPNSRQHWISDYKTILAKAAAKPKTLLGCLVER
jgi:acyl-CoA synthetase (AMP-forming)/AMP-acid ligase II/acyl carrier protein